MTRLDARAATIDEGGVTLGLGPAELLARFVAGRDEAAFAALVARHGPMVLATCRRLLPGGDDADDAFQATFLVLARRAGSVRPERLAPWLHGVARRVAARARAVAARRRDREGGDLLDVAAPPPRDAEDDLRAVLDEELGRLPERFRTPLVLCYLDGLTHDEAADQLGWPVGSVRSRLARGRDRLRGGLSRRGLAPGLLASSSPATPPPAAVSPALRAATTRLALLPPDRAAQVAAGLLAHRTLTTMLIKQLGTVTTLVAAGLAIAAGALAATTPGAVDPSPPAKPPPAAAPQQSPVEPAKAPDEAGLVTRVWDLDDFSRVDLAATFQAEIRLGDKFAVATTVEAPVADLVEVRRDGPTLRVGLAPTKRMIRVERPLRVRITLPRLEEIELSGAARATLLGEPSVDRLRARLGGAARLDGTIRAKQLDLEAQGASRVALRGGADKARIVAGGTSRLELANFPLDANRIDLNSLSTADLTIRSAAAVAVDLSSGAKLTGSVEAPALEIRAASSSQVEVSGKVDRLTLDGSSSCRAELGKLAVAAAKVDLSSSACASVLATKSLRYALSSSARLESLGDPAECDGAASSGAKFSRVP